MPALDNAASAELSLALLPFFKEGGLPLGKVSTYCDD
jgi:hypothetical protein